MGVSLDVGLDLAPGQDVELLVADLSLARAFFEGVPAARLLARVRLALDTRDLSAPPAERGSYDALIGRMLGTVRPALDRVRRAVVRHTRAASDEGPLPASEATFAALACTVALAPDIDASISEALGEQTGRVSMADLGEIGAFTLDVLRDCGSFDPRLLPDAATQGARVALFEACVRLATSAAAGPWPHERLFTAARDLYASDLAVPLLRIAQHALLPRFIEVEARRSDRRMVRLERAELDALVRRDVREVAAAIARSNSAQRTHLDSFVGDLGHLLSHGGVLVLSAPLRTAEDAPSAPPPSMRPSWIPTDWALPSTAISLAEAVEQGAVTLPRVHTIIERGGEPALDAIGAEMLKPTHPFASAAFADILSRSGRARDVMRLVTYFAVAPDPAHAARALAASPSPEVATVLRAWLEAMLPQDGAQVPSGDDPDTSSAARVRTCIAALEPYPTLYKEVCPLLVRVSVAP
jgi:hypothetical protein